MPGTTFVVGFGGSGARVLEASTYLAACGYARNPYHLLMVDPDKSNGNVLQYREQAQRYREVSGHVRRASSVDANSLFALPVNAHDGESSLAWEYPLNQQPFESVLELQRDPDAARLYKVLFDEEDLQMQFSQGYVGRAHVGSLDLYRVLRRAAQEARRAHRPDDDNDGLQVLLARIREAAAGEGGATVVIVGSVFGGTGASGLPAFPNLLRKCIPPQHLQQMRIVGVLLGPYFGIPPGERGAPDSALHPLATRASLYHYAYTQAGYNRLYFVGAPAQPNTNELNRLGGVDQRNAAHYVELAAALAIESASRVPARLGDAKHAETEIFVSTNAEVAWEDMPTDEARDLKRRFATLATFCAFHGDVHARVLREGRHTGAKWFADLCSARGRRLGGAEPELEVLTEFCGRFMTWMHEVQHLNGEALFSVGDRSRVETMEALLGPPTRPGDGYHELVSGLDRVGALDAETALGWYVRAGSISARAWCESNYVSWWGATTGGAHAQA